MKTIRTALRRVRNTIWFVPSYLFTVLVFGVVAFSTWRRYRNAPPRKRG